jgi:hypothetical protein
MEVEYNQSQQQNPEPFQMERQMEQDNMLLYNASEEAIILDQNFASAVIKSPPSYWAFRASTSLQPTMPAADPTAPSSSKHLVTRDHLVNTYVL